ncbi:MAG: DUF4412 domain-containing protein [Bacteroidota bacterium]
MKPRTACMAMTSAILLSTILSQARPFENNASSLTQTILRAADPADIAGQYTGSWSNTTQIKWPLAAAKSDTSPIISMLNALVKTVKDNPNDTSSADLTMKTLGNLMGGGGVSAADSAAAIKSFMSAKGGNGFFYQYATSITTKQSGTTADTSNRYFTSSGEGRSEMNIPAMMGVKGANSMIILAHAHQRHYSLNLDQHDKTYSLNVIDSTLIARGRSDYRVTKIGNETVQGYNCIHARLVSTFGSGRFSSTSTMDIWTSTNVPGYALFKSYTTSQNITPGMLQALEQAGCNGFFVKMTNQDKNVSMNMQLIKAQQMNLPASLFRIPAGYTLSDENMIQHMIGTKK